jgi:hypothetical protein
VAGRTFFLIAAITASMAQTAPPPHDGLIRAHEAYNAHQYTQAIAAATEVVSQPDLADAANVVIARAHLEQFRLTSDGSDRDAAHEALARVHEEKLAPRDRVEFLVGLGESLYLDDPPRYSAAAQFFDWALARADGLAPDDREPIFEWWANALDCQAQLFLTDAERKPIYDRILARAEDDLARNDRAIVASYWLVAAARGSGDVDRAWGAAQAGWIRAGYLGARGQTLRTDLDRFVTQVVVPERARLLAPDDPSKVIGMLMDQWTELKKRWP